MPKHNKNAKLTNVSKTESEKSQNIQTIDALIITEILRRLYDQDLIYLALNPVNSQWHTLSLTEMFMRTSDDALIFQGKYVDFIFRHHDQVSRSGFIDVLARAGILKNWHILPDSMATMIFGAVFKMYPLRAAALKARTLMGNVKNTDITVFGFKPRLTNALISIYCLAETDAVRDYLFNQILQQAKFQGSTQDEALELLTHLAPYLIKRHLKIARNLYKTLSAESTPEVEQDGGKHFIYNAAMIQLNAANVRSSSFIRQQTIPGILDFIKVNWQVIYSQISFSVLSTFMLLEKPSFITVLNERSTKRDYLDEIKNKADIFYYNNPSLWSTRLSAHYFGHIALRKAVSVKSKVAILLDLLKGYEFYCQQQDPHIFDSIIPLLADINLAASLTEIEFATLNTFCNDELEKHLSLKWDQVVMLTILILHRQLPDLQPKVIFDCLLYFSEYLIRSDHLTIPLNLIQNFYSLFQRINVGSESDYLEQDAPYTMFRFMNLFIPNFIYSINVKERSCYGSSLLGLTGFPAQLKGFAFSQLLEKLTANTFTPLFCMPHFVGALNQVQVDRLFKLLTEKCQCTMKSLHLNIPLAFLVPVLHILFELNSSINVIIDQYKSDLINNFLSAALSTKNVLFSFIIYYRPALNSKQTRDVLTRYLTYIPGKSLAHEFPDLFHKFSNDDHSAFIAAMANNLKSEHIDLLEKLAHVGNAELDRSYLHRLFSDVTQYEQSSIPKSLLLKSVNLIKNAIVTSNGYSMVNHGIFRGQPNRPFREMLELVDSLTSGTVDVKKGFSLLITAAKKRNAHNLLKTLISCQEEYFNNSPINYPKPFK